MAHTEHPGNGSVLRNPPERTEAVGPSDIREQLKRLLDSRFFRSSKRCSHFLECVVEHFLAGTSEPLKERTLGVNVFGRNPSYDTAADPIVRVTAGEVRRRLAQYYAEDEHHGELRVDLPSGGYVPTYSRPQMQPAPVSGPDTPLQLRAAGSQRPWWAFGSFAAVLVVILLAAPATNQQATSSAFERFWAPLLNAPVPVLLCAGGLDMYELPGEVKAAANAASNSSSEAPTLEISARHVERVGARYVAIGDAVAIARIAALFQQRRHPYQIREHTLTSFADLRASPAVLIGMFSNAWTLQLGSEFRFVPTIEGDGHHVGIIDRQRAEQPWRLPRPWPSLNVARDYALVSRVVDAATGTLVLTVGGITPFGTSAAAEFLTDRDQLEKGLSEVRDWPNRNLQVVLETQVIDGAAGAPRVVATHVW